MAKIKKELGEKEQLIFLVKTLGEFTLQFNIGKNMNAPQILDTAKVIAQEYYFMKASELKYVLNKAKTGHYGQMYDRLDGPLILGWLNTYMHEREDTCANYQETKNIEHKKDNNEALENEKMQEIYKSLKNSTKMKEEKKEEEKSERQRANEMAQSWLKEFDELERKQNHTSGGIRFVKVGKLMMNQEEFFAHKHHEYNDNLSKTSDE